MTSSVFSRSPLHLQAPFDQADRVCVYGRLLPCSSSTAESPTWVTMDSSCATLYCGSDPALASSHTVPTLAKARRVTAASKASPSPPPQDRIDSAAPSASSSSPTSIRLDGVMGDIRSPMAHAFLDSAAHACVTGCVESGMSATVLCCGEKGTGKSTTLFGDAVVPGLAQRILTSFFAVASARPPLSSRESSPVPSTASLPLPSFPKRRSDVRAAEEEVQCSTSTQYRIALSCIALRGESVVDLLAESAAVDTGRPVGTLHASTTAAAAAATAASPPLFSSSSASATAPRVSSTAGGSSSAVKPSITMDARGEVAVRGITSVPCRTGGEALALVDRCRRSQASLTGHQVSPSFPASSATSSSSAPTSLSHLVLVMDIVVEEGEQGNTYHHVVKRSQVLLVDLAAVLWSPGPLKMRAQKSQPLTATSSAPVAGTGHASRMEDAAIRLSLTTLYDVIVRLSASQLTDEAEEEQDAAKAPPYRQSKLTMLLKGHFGRGCRTLVIAHVRPEQAYRRETLCTLQLARQLLCVPQKAATSVSADPVTQVHQLQRQLASLQMELRLQVELNAQAGIGNDGTPSSRPSSGPLNAGTGSGTIPNDGARAKKRPGAESTGRGTPSRHQRSALSPVTGASPGDRGNATTAEGPQDTDCDNRLFLSSASNASIPAFSRLLPAVRNFVAGRIPTLPVSNVNEMHTCFELLRQCVTEKELRLSAALSDMRMAEAAAAAVLTSTGIEGYGCASSERGAQRSPSSTRLSGFTGGNGNGSARRRTATRRASLNFSREGSTSSLPKARSGVEQSRSASTALLPLFIPSRTAMLHEPSPSTSTSVVGGGKGFGSASPAIRPPRETRNGSSGSSTTPPPNTTTFDGSCTPVKSQEEAYAMPATDEGSTPPRGTFPAAVGVDRGKPPSYGWSTLRNPSSAPPSSSLPLAPPEAPSQSGLTLARAPSLAQKHPSAALSNVPMLFRPSSAPVTALPLTPESTQTSPMEASAFHVYITQETEGVQQVSCIHQEEEELRKLRCSAGSAKSSQKPGSPADEDVALEDACRYRESQLARRRDALLKNFETWYRAKGKADVGADAKGPSANATFPSTTEMVPVDGLDAPDRLLSPPRRTTLDVMRRRLHSSSSGSERRGVGFGRTAPDSKALTSPFRLTDASSLLFSTMDQATAAPASAVLMPEATSLAAALPHHHFISGGADNLSGSVR